MLENAKLMRCCCFLALLALFSAKAQESDVKDTIKIVDRIVIPPDSIKTLDTDLTKELQNTKVFREQIKKVEAFEKKTTKRGIPQFEAQKARDREQVSKMLKVQEEVPEFQVQEQEVFTVGAGEDEKEGSELSDEGNNTPEGEKKPAPTFGLKSISNSSKERNTKRIQGPSQFDSRIEVRKLNPNIYWQFFIQNRTRSVGMVIEKKQLKKITDSIYQFKITRKLGDYLNLCQSEPFREQPAIGVGTAFVIDERTMLTARHVFTKTLDKYAIVFGYEVANEQTGVVETVVHARDLHFPVNIKKTLKVYDTSLVELDRPIKETPLAWESSKNLKNGAEIYMIGHPLGLPKKIALNADIIDNSHSEYFYTSLDSFQGNSGSPVFHFNTHKVIGILVSGQLDFKYTGNCYESNICDPKNCEGEKVIRIEQILKSK